MKPFIPKALMAYPQWVGYRIYHDGKSKPKKRPINPHTGELASVNDPSTWGSYSDAVAAIKRFGPDGLGFVFTERDPFCGVDLDDCRDPETGKIKPRARRIIRVVNTCTEISPSGKGVHILSKATLSGPGRNQGGIEVYDRGRFFTITGQRLAGTPMKIMPRQDKLEWLLENFFPEEPEEKVQKSKATPFSPKLSRSEAWVIQRASSAKNGVKFRELFYEGGKSYQSHSHADMALCGMLAFWTGCDPILIDRIFRKSALFRSKWDQNHYKDGRTYGEETIRKAIANCSKIYQKSTSALKKGRKGGEK